MIGNWQFAAQSQPQLFHMSPVAWMNEWIMHLYSALLCIVVPKALYNHVGGLSSTTTSVQLSLGWCGGCRRTTALMRSPHTSYRWRGERDIEPLKWCPPPQTPATGERRERHAGYALTTPAQVERERVIDQSCMRSTPHQLQVRGERA